MSEITIIEEKPIALYELKGKLETIKARDKELKFRGNKTEGYLNSLVKTHTKNLTDLEKDLEKVDVSRLRTRHIKKIVDIQPQDLDSLRTLLSGENITLKTEDLEKIVSIVKKHV